LAFNLVYIPKEWLNLAAAITNNSDSGYVVPGAVTIGSDNLPSQ
jgi:hypothetical protein